MVDAIFGDGRLAQIYDYVDDDRSDLDVYVEILDELGATSVLDIGCGTGSFASLLARRGKSVIGVDPAAASLEVASGKAGAGNVQWVLGDASDLPPMQVDLVTMTGNVAQVFVSDEEWSSTLVSARDALRPGGWLVFETRDPSREAWREWTRGLTLRTIEAPGVGVVETWTEVVAVEMPLVSFRTVFVFTGDEAMITSESTLRFRSREEVTAALRESGFGIEDIRDAPDRPGREFVFVARRVPT